VIATGGSVCYCDEAMQALKKNGIVVYIKQDFEAIRKRVGNLNKRGVVIRQGTTLRALYDERVPLYEKYADLVVDVSRSRSLKESIDMVISAIENCGLL
jgi:shikimate kinase